MALYVDAKSVFAAVTATFVKTPAEKSLLSHVQYLRELLDIGLLHSLLWLDTRDMYSDGLTKGSVDRAALHELMECKMIFRHALELWRPKLALAQQTSGSNNNAEPSAVHISGRSTAESNAHWSVLPTNGSSTAEVRNPSSGSSCLSLQACETSSYYNDYNGVWLIDVAEALLDAP